MSKKEIILKILEGLNQNSKLLSSGELGIAEELLNEVVTIAIQGNLIFGATATFDRFGKPEINCPNKSIISITGIEYLEKNKQ